MRIDGACVLVTGANRGLGKALADAFAARGAACVYAAGRDRAALETVFSGRDRIRPISLDVTSDASVAEAARLCPDTTILVNNAGIVSHSTLIGAPSLDDARLEMETNYWGMLRLCRAFAPVLRANGGGAIANILSMGALASMPFVGTYCASKAAALSLTQGIRGELEGQGTLVVGVIAGPIQTDMAREHEKDGRFPAGMIAAATLDGIEARQTTIYPDPRSADVGAVHARDPAAIEAAFGLIR
ncbi:SDR family oxidoreductase [Iodidimonas sp. SYSU 1G8]|uniref:SDR family oxidoreductase n=1 Tax=Iodidimonas sp. SYSU 1G8 TaxID=3133967 RepID=UPI0031FE63A5